MSQLTAGDFLVVGSRRTADAKSAGVKNVPVSGGGTIPTQDELDWAENQARSPQAARRLDGALIGLAVTLAAALVVITIRLL